MRKRNLIICPNCRERGVVNILGEMDKLGHFLVMRFHKGLTRIVGQDFAVVCDKCKELVYIRRKRERVSTVSVRRSQVFAGTLSYLSNTNGGSQGTQAQL